MTADLAWLAGSDVEASGRAIGLFEIVVGLVGLDLALFLLVVLVELVVMMMMMTAVVVVVGGFRWMFGGIVVMLTATFDERQSALSL